METKGHTKRAAPNASLREAKGMEVAAASLELLCAVWVVRHSVAAERVAAGTAVPHPVADVVAAVRRWALGGKGAICLRWKPKKVTALVRAALVGSMEGVQFALGEMPPDEREEAKEWALDSSAGEGKLDVVQWLVEEKGVDVHGGRSAPLWCSAGGGHLNVVRWLVEHAGAVDQADGRCLENAASNGHLPVVRWLLEEGGGDVHANDDDALYSAAETGNLPLVRWLVEEGGADANADEGGALNACAQNRHLHVLRWLVEEGGGDVHQFGDAPLHCSVGNGDVAMMQWLVKEGGADVHARGDWFLVESAMDGKIEVLRWLLSPVSGVEWAERTLKRALEHAKDADARDALSAALCPPYPAFKKQRST